MNVPPTNLLTVEAVIPPIWMQKAPHLTPLSMKDEENKHNPHANPDPMLYHMRSLKEMAVPYSGRLETVRKRMYTMVRQATSTPGARAPFLGAATGSSACVSSAAVSSSGVSFTAGAAGAVVATRF